MIKMSLEEYMTKGHELFGKNMLNWKFVCPNCGNVQSPEDFRKYKDKGAKPDDARFNCIGRFMEDCRGELGNGKSPCNYTAGGLIRLSPIQVEHEDGEVSYSFAFAEQKEV